MVGVQNRLGIPVKLVGLGEGIDDFVDFAPTDFVDALLLNEDEVWMGSKFKSWSRPFVYHSYER